MKIKIDSENKNKRFDIFLATLAATSRTRVQKLIKEGKASVNGNVQSPSHMLSVGEEVEFDENDLNVSVESQITPEKISLNVIYEDDELLVVDKPAGMVVHPANGNWSGTLVNAVLGRYEDQTKIPVENRFGLIHRLDKDTSGVILIAKTSKALDFYSSQFENRLVKKQYLCLVSSKVLKYFEVQNFSKDLEDVSINYKGNVLEVEGYLGRDNRNRQKMRSQISSSKNGSSRYSITYFEVLSKNSEEVLLKAFPKTGRTHQIRVHLKALGTPIFGDVKYGGVKYTRLMLHALSLEIKLISGEVKTFTSNVPAEFARMYDQRK